MICPSCNRSVCLFNPSLRRQKCPHCGASVRKVVRHRRAFLLGLGIAFVPMILATDFSGPRGYILTTVGAAIVVILGLLSLTQFELRAVGP